MDPIMSQLYFAKKIRSKVIPHRLIFSSLTKQALIFCGYSKRWRNAICLIIGNDFNSAIFWSKCDSRSKSIALAAWTGVRTPQNGVTPSPMHAALLNFTALAAQAGAPTLQSSVIPSPMHAALHSFTIFFVGSGKRAWST